MSDEKSIHDRLWCPACQKTHFRPTHTDDPEACNDCGTTLDETRPLRVRVRERVGQVVALAVLVAIFAGPPAFVVRKALSDAPLYATRTVTRTQHYGVIPESVPLLAVWGLLLVLLWGSVSGRLPAPSGGF